MEDGGGDAGECVCLVRGGGRDLDVGEDDGGEEGAGEESSLSWGMDETWMNCS